MNHKQAKIALAMLITLSATSSHALVRKTTRDALHKTRTVATTQIKNATAAVAQGVDHLFYPVLCYMLGKHIYDNHVSARLGEVPKGYLELEQQVPFADQARHFATRLIVGSLAVSGAHALLSTDIVGQFVTENMPRLSRLLAHIGEENGLTKNRARKKSAL